MKIIDLKDKVENTPLWKHFLFFMIFGPFMLFICTFKIEKIDNS